LDGVKSLCSNQHPEIDGDNHTCPFAFFTCTNTLGNNLLFADQVGFPTNPEANDTQFAVPPALGALAGESLHTLSLGNVYTFTQLLGEDEYNCLKKIIIIGVGGVTSKEAAERMKRAGASVVGCATLFGKQGLSAFEIITGTSSWDIKSVQ
jgi:dihydroorotate dehydrogenase (fumarate)